MINEDAMKKAREKINDQNGELSLEEDHNLEGQPEESIEGQTEADIKDPKVAELEALVEEHKNNHLRALAEVDNIRKRAERERDDLKKYAVTSFARELLNVSDNLRRALESIASAADSTSGEAQQAFVSGVEMTERELLAVFERHGIQKIIPQGEPFNHAHHQAMFEVEATEGQEPGTISQVLQPGYLIHDRLLRPAMVAVVKKAAQ